MGFTLVRVTDLVYATDRSTGEPLIKLAGRDEHGDRYHAVVTGTEPYAFVPAGESLPDRDYIRRVEPGYEGYDGTPLNKVVTRLPEHVNQRQGDSLSDHVSELYEGDIPFVRRVSIDYGLSGYVRVPSGTRISVAEIETAIDPSEVAEITPRVMLADIEVDPPDLSGDRAFQDFVADADQPVTAITTYDSYTDEYLLAVLDPDDAVDPGRVRHYLEAHWGEHDRAAEFTDDADMRLVQADTEAALFRAFITEIKHRQPDLLSGWNWVDFDHEYLLNRLRHDDLSDVNEHRLSDCGAVSGYKTAQKIDGLPGFDMMEAFCGKMTFSEWRSQRLDYVADEELAIGKVEDMSIGKAYRENRSRFAAYNLIDTQLLTALDQQQGIHEFFYLVADLAGIQIYDTFSEMRIVDGFVMSRRSADEILPSMDDKELDEIAGGLVLSPADGVHEWVAVFDVKSLYPSIFITLNVSEETLTLDPEVADLVCPAMPESAADVRGEITVDDIEWGINDGALGLSAEHEGLLPKYLKLLFDRRAEFKDRRDGHDPDSAAYDVWDAKQYAIKVIMNSFYGVSQNQWYRLSTPIRGSQGVGSTITAGGRYTVWRGAQIAAGMGFDVRYGDTDSIFISLTKAGEDPTDLTPETVVQRGKAIEAELNERMADVADAFGVGDAHPYLADADLHGTDRHCISWEFEKLYRRYFQAGKKKRYAGLPVWKEGKWHVDPATGEGDVEPDITGFESKRADVPEVTEAIQTDIMERVLDGQDFNQLADYLTAEVTAIREIDKPISAIAYPGTLKKPLDQYANTQTARACRYSIRHLGYEWREGDDPWVVPVRETPPMMPDTDVIALEWGEAVPEGFAIDTDEIIQKKVKAPLEPILGTTGWTFEELHTGRQVQGVDLGGGAGDATNPFADAGGTDNRDTASTPSDSDATASDDADEPTADERAAADSALSW